MSNTQNHNNNRSKSNGNTSRIGQDAAKGIGRVLIEILTVPPRIIAFLTSPPGNAIMLGLGVMYFAGVSAEGYWQSMNTNNPAFVPKPFINDNANPLLVWVALTASSFWMASVVSLIIQGVQAFVLREYEIAKTKALYDEVKDFRVPNPEEGQLDIAEYRRRQLKSVGMRTIRTRGALIALTYLIDFAQSFWNYPLIGQNVGIMFVHLIWGLASVFGTESMINLFLNSLYPIKPQVEVLP